MNAAPSPVNPHFRARNVQVYPCESQYGRTSTLMME